MPTRSWIVLGLGLVIAIGTALSLKSRMQEKPQQNLNQVLVASADIPAGSFVRSDVQLAFSDWPEANITPSMFTITTTKTVDFNGAVARRTVQKGEPILKNLLVRSNEGGFMSAVLDPGKRAVSIAVDSTTGNAGFIFPGDHVDLILTHSVNSDNKELRASETFIQDARVLAVDQKIDNPENKAMLAKTVTLEVTPKQAEEINLAKDLGKISLSLRSLARKKDVVEVAPLPADGAALPPENLDDVLKEQLPGADTTPVEAPDSHMTRDTDISKIITQQNVGARVRVIRGNEKPEDIQFGPTTVLPNANP
ncbi:MAG: Flp pilus assembly protein CpaB [Rickettsiales bacterium]